MFARSLIEVNDDQPRLRVRPGANDGDGAVSEPPASRSHGDRLW
jgi:hypothetical protein